MVIDRQQKPKFSGFSELSVICSLYILSRNGLEKMFIQKDKICDFKQQELEGIFTINNHVFHNSIQINIKFTFIVYEYMIDDVLYLLQYCRNSTHTHTHTHTHMHTHWSNWLHIHIIFPGCFYLIIVTSRNRLSNCEHDPSYQ